MVQFEGKYTHQKNENLDEYFKALGVPYIPRKMMCSSSPSLEISKNGEEWNVTIATLMKTTVNKFKLGEEYEESMPGGILKNNTILEGDKLITKSVGPNNTNISRIYEFSDDGCVIIYKHETSGIEAKRYFKRM
ncbi:fatty acid-binding protein homolog 5-like [Anoplophora glabripennis]|uniref:fatty acid-binding protein homolog 5-like n=1 Tax=Anoplophora glabripennis TaxID=217634 RepID=UPI0008740DEE|nr:fatty acid-binding protein homolog 5-like [Anoplophora glabripennis]XP_018561456.1 fatty acid-binding protein homolog 5-like [Anoplophora glabripennis]